ncbi:hypothetical protein CASFOL_023999 [Castilleja foliolosa]|uniref:Glycoside hydrolase family 38 N-terminal domain-containing protein n=1 Tax=Castilleja foliolosa TaxID=1961234 RepID=A0ABD3CQL7_9LAMI
MEMELKKLLLFSISAIFRNILHDANSLHLHTVQHHLGHLALQNQRSFGHSLPRRRRMAQDRRSVLRRSQQLHLGACVQNVLDSVIPALLDDKNRKFIYVEMAFFQRWWRQQSDTLKAKVKQLVNSGQLEFMYALSSPF